MNHHSTSARLLADLTEAIELVKHADGRHTHAALLTGRKLIAAGHRRGPGHILSVLSSDGSGHAGDRLLADLLPEELRRSIVGGATELQIFRFRYNSLRIEGPSDDTGAVWTTDLIRQRMLEGEYEGLDLYPGFPLRLRDLAFLNDLQELCLLGVQTKVADDRAGFTLAGLEELALTTGCRQPVPEVILPALRRLVLVERHGIECRKWPALEEFLLGVWRSNGVGFLYGGERLRDVELQGTRQSASLVGIETCVQLESLRVLDAAVDDLAPLRELSNLRELKLGSRLSPQHSLDLRDLTSPVLEKLWLGGVEKLRNLSSLEDLPALRELRLAGCALTDADRVVLDRMADRVEVAIHT